MFAHAYGKTHGVAIVCNAQGNVCAAAPGNDLKTFRRILQANGYRVQIVGKTVIIDAKNP